MRLLSKSIARPLIAIGLRPYDAAMPRFKEDRDDHVCKGNLYLLSGRLAEARRIFEEIYERSVEGGLAGATENLARCIKAEDGTIGRANKFALDLRPTKDPPSSTQNVER